MKSNCLWLAVSTTALLAGPVHATNLNNPRVNFEEVPRLRAGKGSVEKNVTNQHIARQHDIFHEKAGLKPDLVCETRAGTVCALKGGDGEGGDVPLLDPCSQTLFEQDVPNPLDPGFTYDSGQGKIKVEVCKNMYHITGIKNPCNVNELLETPIYGYIDGNRKAEGSTCTWPGKTVNGNTGKKLEIEWKNSLGPSPYLLTSLPGDSVVDTSLHWAYGLHGYENYTIEDHGVPIITHVHGGHTDYEFDGNAEFFYNYDQSVKGPPWTNPLNLLGQGGSIPKFIYENSQRAAAIWYHDHTLGITRLNVYAGMAGFFIIRDKLDKGKRNNHLTLPVFPYEICLAMQDRMFKQNGELFYPAFPGDPGYSDYITNEGEVGVSNPTVLAEFFGDYMVVNGKIWPKMAVTPTGTPFAQVCGVNDAVPFHVIGSDQGLRYSTLTATNSYKTLLVEPGSRYDIVIDFIGYPNRRVIMANLGPDAPFNGDFVDPPVKTGTYLFTDRIMAFDVSAATTGTGGKKSKTKDSSGGNPVNFNLGTFNTELTKAYATGGEPYYTRIQDGTNPPTRRVGLFEGRDEHGRLQPLQGTIDPVKDPCSTTGDFIRWPTTFAHGTHEHTMAHPLAGKPMVGTMAWHERTTELPVLGTTEYWEIWNLTPDVHPMHLHLVHFEVVGRYAITFEGDDEIPVDDITDTLNTDCVNPADTPPFTGTYLFPQPLVEHNGEIGQGYKVCNPTRSNSLLSARPEIFEDAPKDIVSAYPNEVTIIKAHFDKAGPYSWHCHIVSHEDHEMMRRFEVITASPSCPLTS